MSGLRSFLEENGDKVVFWDQEVSVELEAARLLLQYDGVSPVFLRRVRGFNIAVVGNVVANRSFLLKALGVSEDGDAYRKLLNALASPTRLKEGDLEEYHKRVEVRDLGSFIPILKYYPEEGGRYVTSSIIMAGDGEGVYNASIHRMMFLGGRRFAVRIVPRHLYYMHSKYRKIGKDLPVAVSIGVHPALLIAAASSPPFGIYEMEVANTLLGDKLRAARVFREEIPVPLDSEIIMLGRLRHDLEAPEGPYVDLTSTLDIVRNQPVLEVDELWVRSGAVYHAIVGGSVEHRLLMGFPREAMIWDSVRKVVPAVRAVRLSIGGVGWLHGIVSIRKAHEGDGKNAILAAFAAHPSMKHVVVVDEDIDVDDPRDVEWAIATRFRADRDLIVITHVRGSTLDPTSENGMSAKMGLDATAPIGERRRFFRKARRP